MSLIILRFAVVSPNDQEETTVICVYRLVKKGYMSVFATSLQPHQAVGQVLQLKEEVLE